MISPCLGGTLGLYYPSHLHLPSQGKRHGLLHRRWQKTTQSGHRKDSPLTNSLMCEERRCVQETPPQHYPYPSTPRHSALCVWRGLGVVGIWGHPSINSMHQCNAGSSLGRSLFSFPAARAMDWPRPGKSVLRGEGELSTAAPSHFSSEPGVPAQWRPSTHAH